MNVSEPKEFKFISNVAIIINNNRILNLKGMWDTGATTSCLDIKYLDVLNIKSTASTEYSAIGIHGNTDLYQIDLLINDCMLIHNLRIASQDLSSNEIQFLIGMDIISLGDFSINTINNKTIGCFRYPTNHKLPHDTNDVLNKPIEILLTYKKDKEE